MRLSDKLKNHKLRYREKFGNSSHRQLFRLAKMLLRHPILSVRQGILKVILGLSYQCQCACTYCCVAKYSKLSQEELSTSEIEHIISKIAILPSLFTIVTFFGGEAMLRKDIFQLIEYTTNKGIFTEIESNGILLFRENIIRLKKAGLHHIFVRLESAKSQVHDRLSNYEGCFKKVIEGIKNCGREKVSCSISTIALKEKIYNGDLKNIISLGKRLKVSSVRLLYPMLAGNWINAKSELLNTDEQRYVRSLLRPDFVYLESSYSVTNRIEKNCASIEKKLFYISPYGEVQPCPFIPINFGNTHSKSLPNILEEMWQNRIFKEPFFHTCPINETYFLNCNK